MDLEINKADREKDQEVAQKHLSQKARVEGKLYNSIPLPTP